MTDTPTPTPEGPYDAPSVVVLAITTTFISESQQIIAGQLWEATHPIVAAYPGCFETNLMKGAIHAPGVSSGTVVVANQTTFISESQQIIAGRLWDSAHPIVMAWPLCFESNLLKAAIRTPVIAGGTSQREAVVEQTTAAPGEKRTTARARAATTPTDE